MNSAIKIGRKLRSRVLAAHSGFTLVELIISLAMSGIVLSGIFVVVSGSHQFILNARKRTDLQQDFSLISTVMGTNIRQAIDEQHKIYTDYAAYLASGPTQSTGSCMKLYFPSGDSVLLYKENADFKIRQTNGTIANLVPLVLDSLRFTDDTKSIQTMLSLSNSYYVMVDTLLDSFRNFGAAVATVDTLRPTGVGTWSNNTPVGDSPEWDCVEEVTSDGDATYVYPYPEDDWRTDSYATQNGSGTGTIDSVIVYIRARGADSGDQTRTVVLLSGTRYYGTTINLSSVSTFTQYSTKYTTNPATSTAWTWSEVDAMEIGVRLYRDEEVGPRCTQVWAHVYFSN